MSALWSEQEQGKTNQLLAQFLEILRQESKKVEKTLIEIIQRVTVLDDAIQARIESPEYLDIVRMAFQTWSAGESEPRRVLIRNLLCHAAQTRICSDDVVKLFIQWIGQYSELHFRVIRALYENPGATRANMWELVGGQPVREDSAEADLFKLLTREINVGGVMRQVREKDAHGNFYKKGNSGSKSGSSYMKSAFDDVEPYELTELGKQFVRYTMDDAVPQIGDPQRKKDSSR